MKYSCSKKKIIISCLLITLLLFGAISNSNIFSIVEKFYRHKPSNTSLLNFEDGVLLTAQLGVNFSFFNTTENDWIREIDKATTLIHKKLSIQHRRHGLPFLVTVPAKRQQSVCVVSIHEYSGDQMQSLVDKLMAHKQTFAQHHNVSNMGYINVNAQKYRDDNRHLYLANVSSTWLKLPILRDMILSGQNQQQQQRYEWFMWVDANVLFTNFSCTFQELLSVNHHLIVPGDFNTGVFFIRNHRWSAQFLDLWFSKWSTFRSRLGQEDEALGSLLIDDSWNRHVRSVSYNNNNQPLEIICFVWIDLCDSYGTF